MKKSVLFSIIAVVIVLISFCVTVCIVSTSKKVCDESIDNQIKKAERNLYELYNLKSLELFQDKKYRESLVYLKKDKFSHPDSIACLTKVIDYNEKIAKSPKNYKLYIELAKIHANPQIENCNDYDTAIDLYTKALELNPKATEVYELRGYARNETLVGRRWSSEENDVQKNKFKEDVDLIIADFEKSISIFGETDERLQMLAGKYLSNEYYDKALNTIQKIKVTDGGKYYALALCYDGLNKPQKAIEYFDLALTTPVQGNQPDKWMIKHVHYLRAKNHLKLLNILDCIKDFVISLPFTK